MVRMAIDPATGPNGRLHFVWVEAREGSVGGLPPPPNPLLAAYSDDVGVSMSPAIQLNGSSRPYSLAPTIEVRGPGEVVVAFYDLRDDLRDYRGLEGPTWNNDWSLVSVASVDGGQTYGENVVISGDVTPPERVLLSLTMPPPSIASDDAGRVFVAWHDMRNGDWDVFVSRSEGDLALWRHPVRVSGDELDSGRHQYLPAIDVAPGARVDLAYYDRGRDPDNVFNEVRLTVSNDAGRSFARGITITSDPSDSRFGQTYLVVSSQGRVDFGSGLAVLSRDRSSLAAWTDTRHAIVSPHQDIYFAGVDIKAYRPGAPIAVAIVIGALAAIGYRYWSVMSGLLMRAWVAGRRKLR